MFCVVIQKAKAGNVMVKKNLWFCLYALGQVVIVGLNTSARRSVDVAPKIVTYLIWPLPLGNTIKNDALLSKTEHYKMYSREHVTECNTILTQIVYMIKHFWIKFCTPNESDVNIGDCTWWTIKRIIEFRRGRNMQLKYPVRWPGFEWDITLKKQNTHCVPKCSNRIPISPRGMSRKDCMQTLRQHCINSCYRSPTYRSRELINQSSEYDVGGEGAQNDTLSSPIWDSGLSKRSH